MICRIARPKLITVTVSLGILTACASAPQQPIDQSTVVAMTEGDSDESRQLVAVADDLATKTCGCLDRECAQAMAHQFAEWLRAHPRRSGSAVTSKRVLALLEKTLMCRDKLEHPKEPVDLDTADGAMAK